MTFLRRSIVFGVIILNTVGVSADTVGEFVEVGKHARKDLAVAQVVDGMNADGLCLGGSVFLAKSLKNASFVGANLSGARLQACDFRNASFANATLTGLTISECDITGVDFTDAVINGIKSNDFFLSEEQLKSTKSYKTKNLTGCLIHDDANWNSELKKYDAPSTYDFRNAILKNVVMRGGDFSKCQFDGAILSNAQLRGQIPFEKLKQTGSYKGGILKGIKFEVEFIGNVDFSGIELTNCILHRVLPQFKFANATIAGAILNGISSTQLRSTRDYNSGVLEDITFVNCDFSGLDLSGMNLSGSKFIRCDLTDATFDNSVVKDVKFDETEFSQEQMKSTWDHKHLGRRAKRTAYSD